MGLSIESCTLAKQSGKFAEKLNLIQSEEIKVLRDALGAFHRQIQTQFVKRKEKRIHWNLSIALSWVGSIRREINGQIEMRGIWDSPENFCISSKGFCAISVTANRKSECRDFHIFTAECGLPFSMPVSKRKMLQSFVKQVAQFTFCRYVLLLEENLNLVFKK